MGPEDDYVAAGREERCLLCRRPLASRRLSDDGICTECSTAVAAYLSVHRLQASDKTLAVKHLREIARVTNRYGRREPHRPNDEMLFRVPTYYGSAQLRGRDAVTREEYDEPIAPVLVSEADGLRLVLGSHDIDDTDVPDIQVERRPNGWTIFLHPIGGSDPSGYVYFLDDGRSFILPEMPFGATPPIEWVRNNQECSEVDEVNAEGAKRGRT
jgi:hypothetical protein